VVTNLGPGAPFRGPGGPLICFALDQAVDEAAYRLGHHPIALRRRWDPDPSRLLYRWAQALPAWQDRSELARQGRFGRGVGVAAANWFYWWQSGCQVALSVEGGRLVAGTPRGTWVSAAAACSPARWLRRWAYHRPMWRYASTAGQPSHDQVGEQVAAGAAPVGGHRQARQNGAVPVLLPGAA
jgi:CO/xanthine dehydrogenase Mo-binding subunit